MIRVTALVTLLAATACNSKKSDEQAPVEPPDPKSESAPPPATGVQAPDPSKPATPVELAGVAPGKHEGKHVWSRKLGGFGSDAARGIALGPDGNFVVTGYFSEQVDFGAGPVTALGDKDAFVAKIDGAGKTLWVKQIGGAGEDIGQAVAVDRDGNIVVTGTFTLTADFGSGKPFESAGRTDLFVARYSPDGDHLWSRRAGSPVEDRGYAVAVDSKNNVIVTGYFGEQAINLGGENLGSAGQADIFVVKYAATSEHVWSWRIGGRSDDLGRAIAVDKDDNIVLAGDFNDDIELGGQDRVSSGNADVLLAKFTPEGRHLWSKTFGSSFHDFAVGLAIDGNGHLIITGGFEVEIDFGGETLEGKQNKKEVFLAKLTGAGEHLWSRSFGGRDDDVGSGLAVDAHNDVYMSGWFWREVDFGGGPLESAGQNDIVLAKYAPDGSFVWAKRFGDAGGDFGRSLAVDGEGAVVMVGTFRGNVSFGGDTLEFSGDKQRPHGDMFAAKFTP
jgi:hypothetical protein